MTQSLFAAIIHFFEQDQWPYQVVEENQILLTSYAGQHGEWRCYLRIWEEQRHLSFYSVLPVLAPESTRISLCEFLTRANFGLIIGNFEIDLNDGETRYKTSVDLEGTDPPPVLLRQLLYMNVTTMDKYLPGLLAVLNGTAPVEAIHRVESDEPIAHP